MRNLLKLSSMAGAMALGAALVPVTSAAAADMPMAPPQMWGEVQPPPPAYYPPQNYPPQAYPPQAYPSPIAQDYPPPPPPVAYAPVPPAALYYADPPPPYVAWPRPYSYAPGYWGGYGAHWAYGYDHRGHWRR